MAELPTLKEYTGVEVWDLVRAAGGQKGIPAMVGAWLLIAGIVIFSSTIGAILTALLLPLIILVIGVIAAWWVAQQMADSEFLGIDGRVLFVILAGAGAVATYLAGSPLIAGALVIVGVAVIIA